MRCCLCGTDALAGRSNVMSDRSSVCSTEESDNEDCYESAYGERCIVDATMELYFSDSLAHRLLSTDINDSDNRVGEALPQISAGDVKRLVRAFRGHIELNVVGVEGRSAIWLRDLVDQMCALCSHRAFTADDAIDFIERFVYANLLFTQTMAFVATGGCEWAFERLYGDQRALAASSVHQLEQTLAQQVTAYKKNAPPQLFLFHYSGSLWAARIEDVTDDHVRVLDYLGVQRQTEMAMAAPNKMLVAHIDDLIGSVLCLNTTYTYVCQKLPPVCTIPVDPRITCTFVAPIFFFGDTQ